MKRYCLTLTILLFTFLLHSCSNNNSILKDRVSYDEENEYLIVNQIAITEDANNAYQKNEELIDFSDYDLVASYDSMISCFSMKEQSITTYNESGKLQKNIQLINNYKTTFLSQLSKDEFLIGNITSSSDFGSIDIIHVKAEKEEMLYKGSTVSGLGIFIKEAIVYQQELYILNDEKELYKAVNNELIRILPSEEIVDIDVYQNKLYILSTDNLSIFEDALISRIDIRDLDPMRLSFYDESFYLLSNNSIYETIDFINYNEIEILNLSYSKEIEHFSVLNSGHILLSDWNDIFVLNLQANTLPKIGSTIKIGFYEEKTFFNRTVSKLNFSDTIVEVEQYRGLSQDAYHRKLKSELLIGNAPDIIIFNGDDPINDYIISNKLLDLADYISGDDFNTLEYEMNILNSTIQNEKQYTLILSPTVYYIDYNLKLFEELKVDDKGMTSLEDLYEIYIRINPDLDKPLYYIGYSYDRWDKFLTYQYMMLFYNDVSNYFDYDGNISFKSDDFIEMIHKAKVIYKAFEKSPYSILDFANNMSSENEFIEFSDQLLFINSNLNGYHIPSVFGDESRIGKMFTGFTTNNIPIGNYGGYNIAINKNSYNIELAWDIVKKLISYESELYLSTSMTNPTRAGLGGFAITKQANADKIQLAKETKFKSQANMVDDWYNILKENYTYSYRSALDDVIRTEIYRYFDDEIRDVELVDILQNKVELYLGE